MLRTVPQRWRHPAWSTFRRWRLADIGYCQICRKRTLQSSLHELKVEEGIHAITTECNACGQVTARQRLPIDPTRDAQLDLCLE